ncbi:MAG: hypothetical protein PHU82_02320 [Candidatus Pacebacteria bacterium]|jgi:hypothetical protein|nr:hypothetical protein [Candidatus Paceibacterota bacterium]MDD4994484.1 hypothetical protein [Candidatus Paceibacterota bacterium]
MYSKQFYNKMSRFLLSAFILNLLIWNLFMVPIKVSAACNPDTQNCYSCDPELGKCVRDSSGEYSCSKACNAACAGESAAQDISTSPLTSSCGGSSAGAYPVYIVGSSEQQAAASAAAQGINSLEDLAKITGLADEAIQDLVDLVNQNQPIPEDLKEFAISAIQKAPNISSEDKASLINAINLSQSIPEDLQTAMTTILENTKDITGLVTNKFLDLIFSGMDIQWICAQLTTAAAALPWGLGAVVAQAVAMACPVVLNNVLSELGYYEEKVPTGTITQTIPVPTFKYYKWEVGLPGFIKAGQIIEFK